MFMLRRPSTGSARRRLRRVFPPLRISSLVTPLRTSDYDNSYSTTSVKSSHEVPKFEKYLYHFGLRGDRHPGPKLVYRTSTDIWPLLTSPREIPRMMQLHTVHEHSQLSEDLWDHIRDEIHKQGMQTTSVDPVRFSWEKQQKRGRVKTVTSPVTIWIGVLPDSTTGDATFDSSQEILALLQQHHIRDVDVAYRESVVQRFSDPELFEPGSIFYPLKSGIDPVTTACLSLARRRSKLQALWACTSVSARIFTVSQHAMCSSPRTKGIILTFTSPLAGKEKKEVVLMGKDNDNVALLEKVASRTEAAANDALAASLAAIEHDLKKSTRMIQSLKSLLFTMKKEWSSIKHRIVGHVVWAPPISSLSTPSGYTQDVCVIKLDKAKFWLHFMGNVIDIGTEIFPGKFSSMMLEEILTAAQMSQPVNKDPQRNPVRYVHKRGHATLTTIGRLSGFDSFTRRYELGGTFDSVEAAVFSKVGDSGALIVGSETELAALLTGGTGHMAYSDISYGNPMHWLWEDVIKPQLPNASFHFDLPLPQELGSSFCFLLHLSDEVLARRFASIQTALPISPIPRSASCFCSLACFVVVGLHDRRF
ncbi:hypothetical protein BC835DRAFT_1519984 [Cytidiella melzeri]|nr:hypothetical protein BC835DRAFT_1519984 [Cytidiella melzeri]